jgi:hypothetical protein
MSAHKNTEDENLISLLIRLSDRQKRDDVTGCLNYTGHLDKDGYGIIGFGAHKMLFAHRAAAFFAGVIPTLDAPFHVCHHCDNPACGEETHLYKGNHKTNAMDMASRGRQYFQQHPEAVRRGHSCGRSRLTEEQAREIKLSHERQVKLAKRYNVTQAAISAIKTGSSWKHI